jgi:hypothetical protein
MRILILTAMMALPLMAFGQKEQQPQQPQQPQAPTNEAPATTEKEQPAQPATTKPQTATKPARAVDERKQTDINGGAQVNKSPSETRAESANDKRVSKDVDRTRDLNKTDATTRSSSSTTKTKVSVQEFKSRHAEVFSLGRHPKDFFIQRYGERHFRLFANTYFVSLDGCWVAVEVDGFGYAERVICEGDPEFVEVVD